MLSPDNLPPTIEMVTVPAGEFMMGRGEGYRPRNPNRVTADEYTNIVKSAGPIHSVMLDEYQIGKYLVTNAQYRVFAKDIGHLFEDGPDNHPASGITWQNAELFCAWLRYKTGKPYHLPTEAEWEKAATWNPATQEKQPYPWGSTFDAKRCNLGGSGIGGTSPVGKFSPEGDSPYGCADMIGNLDEWCNTMMIEYPYDPSDGREAHHGGERRAIRGGDSYSVETTALERHAPSEMWQYLWGFRVALGSAVEQAQARFVERIEEWIGNVLEQIKNHSANADLDAQSWYDRGAFQVQLQAQHGVDRFAEAEAALNRAEELVQAKTNQQEVKGMDSPLAHLYYNRAYARMELGKYQEALVDITRALELDPTDLDAVTMRASIECELGQWDAAERDLQTVLKAQPNHPIQRTIQWQIHSAKGQFDLAIQALTDIIDSPLWRPLQRREVYRQRGQVYEKAGNLTKSLSDYAHYVLLCPKAADVPELERKIREGNR